MSGGTRPEMAAGIGQVVAAMRSGRWGQADALCSRMIGEYGDQPALLQLAAMTAGQGGDQQKAATMFARALALDPADLSTRVNLARALLATGASAQADDIAAAGPADNVDLLRVRAAAAYERSDLTNAATYYRQVLDRVPADAGAWNNYGNTLRGAGDPDAAVVALDRAHRLVPADAAIAANLASAMVDAGQLSRAVPIADIARRAAPIPANHLFYARLLAALDRAADALDALEPLPATAETLVLRGQALASLGRFSDAKQTFHDALAIAPADGDALRALAAQLDGENLVEALRELASAARDAGASTRDRHYLDALVARRDGRFAEALAALTFLTAETPTLAELRLEGECADRVDDVGRAWRCFSEVNRMLAAGPLRPGDGAAVYRCQLAETAASTTPAYYDAWRPTTNGFQPRAPVFLVGFPRSGTTLLDTVLLGHPDVAVFEEEPVFQHVAHAAGPMAGLGQLGDAEIVALRRRYFDEIVRLQPLAAGKTVVDKFPLHIARLPWIHRIFPDARFIFVERHPCDVVLSCFMTNFSLNYAVANFLDLGNAATLYDQVMSYWDWCSNLMHLQVHRVRYETLVDDYEVQVRAAVAFVGVEWNDAVLDHQRTAIERGRISTPSYAQVTEPLYRRAKGRWRRYAAQLAPVMPILAPWIERLGYR